MYHILLTVGELLQKHFNAGSINNLLMLKKKKTYKITTQIYMSNGNP